MENEEKTESEKSNLDVSNETQQSSEDAKPSQPNEPLPNASKGLFSDGFFGLLNKGPIGWIIFGLAAGAAYGAYQSLQMWLDK
ncbi:MAG: hypothetical protein K9H49_05255 [Bacteroidales bacterium]|nr:hypothetical protein [Bacteroidales bacterium]MCF8389901.1 hypothetical protein [Bacteroidales bacterium]